MVFLAKIEPGSAAGLNWEKAGEEGAIDVHPRLAYELLSIPGEHFFVTEKSASKSTVAKKVAPKEEVLKEEVVSNDLNEAVQAASPTKRRSTKE